MSEWTEQCALQFTVILLSVDGFKRPTPDGSLAYNERCTK